MAATSIPAFAGGEEANEPEQRYEATSSEMKLTDAKMVKPDTADQGGGSPEPVRADANNARDARADQQWAIEGFDRQRFLNEVWTAP